MIDVVISLLIPAAAIYAFVWIITHGHLPLHWLCHKMNWPIGKFVLWRRSVDNVQMRGRICHICGKLNGVEPVRISYKRMMRGERFY